MLAFKYSAKRYSSIRAHRSTSGQYFIRRATTVQLTLDATRRWPQCFRRSSDPCRLSTPPASGFQDLRLPSSPSCTWCTDSIAPDRWCRPALIPAAPGVDNFAALSPSGLLSDQVLVLILELRVLDLSSLLTSSALQDCPNSQPEMNRTQSALNFITIFNSMLREPDRYFFVNYFYWSSNTVLHKCFYIISTQITHRFYTK